MSKRKQGTGRPVEEPVVKPGDGRLDDMVYTHPAFGAIGASRVSGWQVLHGSDFVHQHYVVVRISPADLHRSLSNDNNFPKGRAHIEVAMSESQWATFVSSMNMGAGVPCTVQALNGQMVPGLPSKVDRQSQFSGEVHERITSAVESLKGLSEFVASASMPKKVAAEVRAKLEMVARQFSDNVPWIAEQFEEHMERTVEAAKSEIEAHLHHRVRSLAGVGLELEAGAAGPAMLPDARDCEECDGAGYIPAGEGTVSTTCPFCDGKGRK